MEYIFTKQKEDYSRLASGMVLYSAIGATAFPVRLGSEILQRCFRHLEQRGAEGPYTLYDPCCGSGYLLAVAGFLHGSRLRAVIGSDIDGRALALAEQNLSLLSTEGLGARKRQVAELYEAHQKPSHMEALRSIELLAADAEQSAIERAECFQADALTLEPNAASCPQANIIIADIPYGKVVDWQGAEQEPIAHFLENMARIAAASLEPCVIAVIADKSQKLASSQLKRIEYNRIGKRHFAIFENH